jgi:hypothetical protein
MEINENDRIKISERIFLRSINLTDHAVLYNLMKTIYPQAYRHLWVDGGKWYMDRPTGNTNRLFPLMAGSDGYAGAFRYGAQLNVIKLPLCYYHKYD